MPVGFRSLRLFHSDKTPLLLAVALAVGLAASGCTRMPRPSVQPSTPAPVFAVVGDTSEVLGTLPEPAVHPRPAVIETPDSSELGPSPADTAAEASDTTADGAVRPPPDSGQGGSSVPEDSSGGGAGTSPGSSPSATAPPGTPPASTPPATSPPAVAPPVAPPPTTPPPATTTPSTTPSGRPAPPAGIGQEPGWGVQLFAGADRARAYREAERARRILHLGEGELAIDYTRRMWRVRAGGGEGRPAAESLLRRARPSFPKAFLVRSTSPAASQ